MFARLLCLSRKVAGSRGLLFLSETINSYQNSATNSGLVESIWSACWGKIQKIQVSWNRLWFTSNRCYKIIQSTVAAENRISLNHEVNLTQVVSTIPRSQSWDRFAANVCIPSLSVCLSYSDMLLYIIYLFGLTASFFWHHYWCFSFQTVPMRWLHAKGLRCLCKNPNIHI